MTGRGSGPPGALIRGADLSWRLLVIGGAVALVSYVLLTLRLVVVPLVLGAAVAALLARQVGWLSRRLPRGLAALLVTLGWLAAVIGLIGFVGAGVSDQFDDVSVSVEGGLARLRELLGNLGLDEQRLAELQDSAVSAVAENQDRLTAGVITGATIVAEILVGLALFAVVLFFCLRDGESMWSWVLDHLPAERQARVDAGGRAALGTLAAYLRGTAVIAFADAFAIGLALALLGVPLVLPLALLVFLGAFIPVVGSALAGSVAVLVALVTDGPVTAGLVLLAVIVVQQVEGDVLAPVVLGRALSLHPLVVVVALTGGAVIGGVLGAAAAVPLVGAAWAVLRAVDPAAPDSPDTRPTLTT